jgi:hypothetical protein
LEAKVANQHIAECCLTYLSYCQDQYETDREYLESNLSDTFPLYAYAFSYFSEHCLQAEEEGCIVPLAINWFKSRQKNSNPKSDWTNIFSTPLIESAGRGMARTVGEVLKTDKSSIELKGGNATATALYYAAVCEHADIVKLLLDHGADANTQDEQGWSAVYMASMYGCTEVVEMLIRKGADPNSTDNDGKTAIHIAVQYKRVETVRALLDLGADPFIKNSEGASAWTWATNDRNTYRDYSIADLLRNWKSTVAENSVPIRLSES